MFWSAPFSRRVAAAILLSAGCWPALAWSQPAPGDAPAGNTSAAASAGATPAPTAASVAGNAANTGQLYQGVGQAFTAALPPPDLPLDFKDFASDFDPQKKEMPQRWLSVKAAFIELGEPPPNGQQVFAVDSLPPVVVDNLKWVTFTTLIGAKSKYENVTVLDHDPHGRALGFSLPLGTTVYYLAREDTPGGLDFSFYYYDARQLSWVSSPVEQDLLLPQPVVIKQKQDLIVPPEKYIMMLTTYRMGPPREGSTARQIPLYGYVVLLVHRLDQSGADQGGNSQPDNNDNPVPSAPTLNSLRPPTSSPFNLFN
jgi:hypothetical protein